MTSNTQKQPTTSQTSNNVKPTGAGSSSGHSKKWKKKKKKFIAKPQAPPVKSYLSKCCGTTAKKPRVGTPLKGKRQGDGEVTEQTPVNGLGGWRCDNCNKPCKVTVAKKEGVINE